MNEQLSVVRTDMVASVDAYHDEGPVNSAQPFAALPCRRLSSVCGVTVYKELGAWVVSGSRENCCPRFLTE